MLTHVRSRQDRNTKRVGADGFTLIELLVVIVILGILAAVVVLGVGAIRNRGQAEACRTELRSVRAAATAFWTDNGRNATAIPDIGDLTNPADPYLDDTPDGSYDIDPATGGSQGPLVTQTACP